MFDGFSGQAQLFLVLSSLADVCFSQSTTRVTIVHTSDIHLHFAESGASAQACQHGAKCHGGLSRFVKFVDDLKEKRSNLLVVDAGGFIQTKLLQLGGGREAVAELVEPLPYDAMAFGASELRDGIDALADYVRTVGQKFVCTNLEFSLSFQSGRFLSSMCHKTMIKMYGELQIGVLSYITRETVAKDIPGITILDEVTALEEGISELEATSADINVILVLGYSHREVDELVLEKVPKINLIIAGHSHLMFYNGTPPSGANRDLDYPQVVRLPDVNNSRPVPNQLVAGGYFHLLYAGKLKVAVTGLKLVVDPYSTSNPVYMDGEKDPKTEELLAKHHHTLHEMLGDPIGFSTFLVDGSRECHRRECSMGNLLTDAMVEAAVLSPELPPDGAWVISAIALLESEGIAASLERGPVYRVDMEDALTDDSSLDLLWVTGTELRLLLENSIQPVRADSQSFLQVSGLKVTGLVPGSDQRPQLNISVVCTYCLVAEYQPLKETANYTVIVTSEFAARVTAPGGLVESMVNRTHGYRLHDSLFLTTVGYINRISPVLVSTGDRLMVRVRSGAAGQGLRDPPAGWWVVAALLMMSVMATVM